MEEQSIQISYDLGARILKIDDIDKKIIMLIQEDPSMTHSKIAKVIKKSQPTVGIRIKKLKDSGILKIQSGINFKNADITLVVVHLKTKNPQNLFEMVKRCPFMLNAFKLSGEYNVSIFLASSDIRHLNDVVNNHFRANSEIQKVSMDLITNIAQNFILPMDIYSKAAIQPFEGRSDANCEYCKKVKMN